MPCPSAGHKKAAPAGGFFPANDGIPPAVDAYDSVEILHLQPANRLRSQILVAHGCFFLDGLRQQRRSAADGDKVHGSVLPDGLHHLCRTAALPDHALQPQRQQRRRVGIHSIAGGGAGGANDLTGLRRGGPHIVNGLPRQLHRQRLSLLQAAAQPLMGGVPCRIQRAAEQHLVPRLQGRNVRFRQRQSDMLHALPPLQHHMGVTIGVAAEVHRHRQSGNVGGVRLDVYRHCRSPSA